LHNPNFFAKRGVQWRAGAILVFFDRNQTQDHNKGMFSAVVLAATTLRESVQLVVSLVTAVAFAVACVVTVSGFLDQNRKKKSIEIDKEK
jgi:Na+(H+)/acetate symporter ActP